MQGIIAYTAAKTAPLTFSDLAALSDPQMPVQNGHFLPPRDLYLYYVYAQSVALIDVRLVSPTLRVPFIPSVWPINQVAAATGAPTDPNIADYRIKPLRIHALEELECDVSLSGVAAQNPVVGLVFGDGDLSVPQGLDVLTVRCTASITAVANAWTSGTLTLGQTIPQGEYTVVGMLAQSATLMLARLIFPGDAVWGAWRPGCVGQVNVFTRPPFAGRKAQQGVMGKFRNTALPQLEILCGAADTTQVVYLDLMKTG